MGLPMGANAHLQGIEDVIQANRGQTDVYVSEITQRGRGIFCPLATL